MCTIWIDTVIKPFFQLEFCKIKTELQKIQLLFSKFEKQFLNFQLESVEYSDTCTWKF